MIRRFFAALGQSFERAYLELALREIDPMHPDLNWIVIRLRELK